MKENVGTGEQILQWLDSLGPVGSLEFRKDFNGQVIICTIRMQDKTVSLAAGIEAIKSANLDILAMHVDRGLGELKSACGLQWTGYEGPGK